MTLNTYNPDVGIEVTPDATAHIKRELEKTPGSIGLRLYLETSGCSGYMYETTLIDSPDPDDEVFQIDDDLKIFIPHKDLPLLNGTEIDFIKVGLNSMFQFRNPNVTGECGCGESFSVTEETS